MPIEIRELVIRTRVEESAAPARHGRPAANGAASRLSHQELEKIVALCLERLQEALKQQTER